MNIILKNKTEVGSCNFCKGEHDKVNVITSSTSYLEIRMCNKCLTELKKCKI